jgi:1-acyl-sn-glycerol-3-phosphate acyltransferase
MTDNGDMLMTAERIDKAMREDLAKRDDPGWVTTLQARVVTYGLRFIAKRIIGFRIEVSGREHIPVGEPLLVAGGPHRNWLDGFLVIMALPPLPRVIFLVTENVFSTWRRRLVLRLVGGIDPVSTTSALNRDALEGALHVLARDERLGIFPEGWDHLDDPPREIGELRRGIAFIAQQSGRRVLPVALAGAKPLWRGKTLRVAIGAPIDPPSPSANKAAQQVWVDELRATLQALLPPEPPEIPLEQRRWTWLTNWLN